jgi:hypothetical protein
MTVRTEILASIPSTPGARNAPPPARFPALAGSRARARHAGPTVVGIVWAFALAFFVLAVAAPAAVMERQAAGARGVAVASRAGDVRP